VLLVFLSEALLFSEALLRLLDLYDRGHHEMIRVLLVNDADSESSPARSRSRY
jgi:hypothetical protein